MRRLRDIGEFGLIERIERQIQRSREKQIEERRAGRSAPGVRLGIGDDAALLRLRAGEELAVSTDALVEDVHFRWQTQSAVTVGRRAVAVALSDLAAMGARPLGCTLALAAPPELPLRRVDDLIRGIVAEAERHRCPLVGGNVARASETSLTLTVLGGVAAGRALRRHSLRAGDRLYVTGVLGAGALALARCERGATRLRHLPVPRLAAGRALAAMGERCACIDVSDGLLADLGHLLEGSELGAELEYDRFPRPRGFESACRRLGCDPARLCLAGGEDYELLFTLPPRVRLPGGSAGRARRLAVAVTEIGRITARPGLRGLPELPRAGGWRHF
ncbi:MAG: thiamine-phosphate kinase [Deltaproteobacteria bacterium]|nr:thiamine-phosphate kinase [Deltaproteobacteria bacterium]MBW2416969.1 thiamine-phosphate kinase [Deltaproteobacteria bacterium]